MPLDNTLGFVERGGECESGFDWKQSGPEGPEESDDW